MYNGKRLGAVQTRVPPEDSEDTCLSDSGDRNGEYFPKPGKGISSNSAWIFSQVSFFWLFT